MKPIRNWGLCFVLAVVGGTIAVPTASALRALPEAGRCVKVATGAGAYRGGACTVLETGKLGKYEWMPASATEKLTFSGGGLEPTLASVGHPTIKCITANITGEYTGPKTVTAQLEFEGCINANKQECHTKPTDAALITSLPLEGELGFVKNQVIEGKILVSVGLDLKPQAPLPDLIVYDCGGVTESDHVRGSVIVRVKPIDIMTTTSNLLITAKKTVEQVPESFEGLPKDTLSTTFMSGLEETTAPSALNVKSETGNNSVALEIKAIEK
jgi:hypothetical protein